MSPTTHTFGRIKAGKSSLYGDAAEHFVIAELLRREVVAALGPRNMANYDILAIHGEKSARIRVKSKMNADTFVWNAKKDGTIFAEITDNDFSVLVDLGSGLAHPEIFIVPTSELGKRIEERYQTWLKSPGKGGRPHKPNKMRRLDDPNWREWLSAYSGENGWNRLLSSLGI